MSTRRKSFALAAATALATVLGAGGSTVASAASAAPAALHTKSAPARAASSDELDTFTNEATGRCVDDSALGLRTFACNRSNYQTWDISDTRNGSFTMRNMATGLCLDDSRDYHLRAIGCNGLIYQQWIVSRRWPDGSFQLSSNGTGLCLDDSNAYHLRTFACGGTQTPWQSWH